ncbi:hypothetical protein EV640_101600 [Nesterenkonia aurantiaca]|uniref:Uncharacterized protein n=1 Tax=Nesterenkonia aurantiaca TaxID=1436010 RepID=A0A4R7G8D8_9MICC|nr:hypothetical protein EV640_101600 [Nesterenkonia aurantiaca]
MSGFDGQMVNRSHGGVELSPPVTALIIGSIVFTMSFRMLSQANPTERIPQLWGRPTHHPGRVYATRGSAVMLLFLAVFGLSRSMGYVSVLLLVLGCLPAWALHIRHNRRAAQTPHAHAAEQPA